MRNKKQYRKSNGATLISLMVGSIISVSVVVSSLSFYRNYLQSAMTFSDATNFNQQVSSVLNGISLEVSSAGFGVDSTNPDVKVTLKNSTSAYDLYWSTFSGQHSCYGIREKHETDTETNNVVVSLEFLESVANCEPSSPLNNVMWKETETIFKVQSKNLEDYLSENNWLFNFSISENKCANFGVNVDPDKVRKILTIETISSLVLFGNITPEEGSITQNFCLSNIQV